MWRAGWNEELRMTTATGAGPMIAAAAMTLAVVAELERDRGWRGREVDQALRETTPGRML